MTINYSIKPKKKLCKKICLNHDSTTKTAEEYNVHLKTLENCITTFNKEKRSFFKLP